LTFSREEIGKEIENKSVGMSVGPPLGDRTMELPKVAAALISQLNLREKFGKKFET
jgi:hypothetical protein